MLPTARPRTHSTFGDSSFTAKRSVLVKQSTVSTATRHQLRTIQTATKTFLFGINWPRRIVCWLLWAL